MTSSGQIPHKNGTRMNEKSTVVSAVPPVWRGSRSGEVNRMSVRSAHLARAVVAPRAHGGTRDVAARSGLALGHVLRLIRVVFLDIDSIDRGVVAQRTLALLGDRD